MHSIQVDLQCQNVSDLMSPRVSNLLNEYSKLSLVISCDDLKPKYVFARYTCSGSETETLASLVAVHQLPPPESTRFDPLVFKELFPLQLLSLQSTETASSTTAAIAGEFETF